MAIQLRQIALVAEQLKPTIEDLTTVLGIRECYVDDGVGVFGLENTLMTVGRNFLEVVAPVETNTAGGRYLERRGGDTGYMVICQATSHAEQLECRERAAEQQVRVVWERESEHHHIMQLHPRDMVASFLEVDWDASEDLAGNWEPSGGSGWEDTVDQSSVVDFCGVELASESPEELANLWGSVLDLPVADDLTVTLNNATLRFVGLSDDRGPGMTGVDLLCADRAAILERAQARGVAADGNKVTLCGTHFYLRDPD